MKLLSVAALVFASLGAGATGIRAQGTDAPPDPVSFFAAVGAHLSETDAFAVDPASFARLLEDELDWFVTPGDVQELLGPDFRYGLIDRFVSCEADIPCQMAYPGTHVVLLRASVGSDPDEVRLRLGLTGGADGGVWRSFSSMTVQRAEGSWTVVER
jgi:hypothetical protein